MPKQNSGRVATSPDTLDFIEDDSQLMGLVPLEGVNGLEEDPSGSRRSKSSESLSMPLLVSRVLLLESW